MVMNPPAVQETLAQSLGQEDLEKGMATLQDSCLGNSMGRGAWRGTVHGVSKSLTLPSNKLLHTFHMVLPFFFFFEESSIPFSIMVDPVYILTNCEQDLA